MSWKFGLTEMLKDPNNVVIRTEQLVAIKDKFPKSKFHFLIMPYENIDSIFDLKKSDVELVNEMQLLGQNVIEGTGLRPEIFRMGFHAVPSMSRIHLHVISRDFISPCLKNKFHWNNFNTEFFLRPSKIIGDLMEHGKVQRISEDEAKKLQNSPLKCNSCPFAAKNIPDLKSHLLSHESLYL